jgi:ketosteroid isomerase-like protein
MITALFAKYFANEWINSWNSRDIEKILNHYSDDFIIETPMAKKILPETGGIVIGKGAVKAYWTI